MMNTRPRLSETDDTVLILDLQGFGPALVKWITAYSSDWVEVGYHDGIIGWYRVEMITRVFLKDRQEHEREQALVETPGGFGQDGVS